MSTLLKLTTGLSKRTHPSAAIDRARETLCAERRIRISEFLELRGKKKRDSVASARWSVGNRMRDAVVEIGQAFDAFSFEVDGVKDVLVTDDEGRFGPLDVAFNVQSSDPISLFRISGGDRANTAWDRRIDCPEFNTPPARCDGVDLTIAVPTVTLVDEWRAVIATDSSLVTETRGLIVLTFQDLDGEPKANLGWTTFARESNVRGRLGAAAAALRTQGKSLDGAR